jgi:succinate dehydrogenase / fumarate reductase flavoprotein subunit
VIEHDLIIVGGGLAGLRAALEADNHLDVALLSRVHPVRSHSVAAQGGINASLGNHPEGSDDSAARHTFDTVKGSDYLADQDAAGLMCELAPRVVCEMEQWGTPFSRFVTGRIAQRPFGGAGFPRTCFASDRTGAMLLHTLYEQSVRLGLRVYEEWLVTRLVVEQGQVCGLIGLNMLTGQLEAFTSRAVLFATGGYGRIYARSTNALINTGSGIGIAYQAGVGLKDMEFVQFHPTTLAGSHILITEGARGEGGHLLNNRGERFMERYASKTMELAPRDIVARAITTELLEGRGVEDRYVHLDLRHLGGRRINERLPGIRQIAIDFADMDPIDSPLPVLPGQHYSMGGIDVNSTGASEITGFYAAGECACVSVHGANRLGGNSLLEAISFGHVAGQHAAQFARDNSTAVGCRKALADALANEHERIRKLYRAGGTRVYALRQNLGEIMSHKVGVFRNQSELSAALAEIRGLRDETGDLAISQDVQEWSQELIDALEFGPMLDVAEVIAAGALRRTESRGSHSRTDFPRRDDGGWLHHTIAHRGTDQPAFSEKRVSITTYEPQERTY